MTQVEHVPKGIGDEQLASSAPLVRALVVERLELLWRMAAPFIDGSGGRVDPRYMELGVRVLDRLMRLYRLDSPAPSLDVPLDLGDRVELVERALAEIEKKA